MQVLSDKLLHQFADRAGGYDRENRFFHEDFEDLKRAGYLTMPVPRELGGAGMTLPEVCREQRRLGYYAPATALGINMHLYWVGLVADLWRQGDHSLEWLLREAMDGEVFNAGHSERGHDLPVLLSTSKAERVDGGFQITGHKMFGTMTPVWTRYGLHATWADAEGGPKIVHAFLPRSHEGWRTVETWDTMGMRATRSDDVVLEGAFVPDKYVARILPEGFAGADSFGLGMFAWALLGYCNIYCGIAQRAIDLSLPGIKSKTSLAINRSMAYHPEIQHAVAEMILDFDPIGPHIDRIAVDWANGVRLGRPRSSRPSTMPSRRVGGSSTRLWRSPAAPACSVPTSWSGCSATRAAVAFIPPTPFWCTKSSPRPRSVSTSGDSRAGDERAARGIDYSRGRRYRAR